MQHPRLYVFVETGQWVGQPDQFSPGPVGWLLQSGWITVEMFPGHVFQLSMDVEGARFACSETASQGEPQHKKWVWTGDLLQKIDPNTCTCCQLLLQYPLQ